MDHTGRRISVGRLVAWAVAGVGTLVGCRAEAPPPPQSGSFRWATYTDPALGYSLQYPDVYKTQASGGSVLFRWQGAVPLRVDFVNERENKHHGLWAGHDPQGDIQLGGQSGKLYIYDHWDGPVHSRTVAYVVPYRGQELGLEFRTEGDLNELERRTLDSFTFGD